jgi:site-specific recombinase XerC
MRLLALRSLAQPEHLARSEGLLLPRGGGQWAASHPLRDALADAAARAGCSAHVTPHRLRHYAASRTMPRESKRSTPRPAERQVAYAPAAQDAA